MQFNRILVPYDFSTAAGHAARYACDLAAHFRAEVTLMHVIPHLRYDFALTEPAVDRIQELKEQRMGNARAALAAVSRGLAAHNRIRCAVMEGEAADEIIAVMNEENYDAVVMSTRGAGAFRRWFIIGSVTSNVLHGAERPVLTSPHFEKHESPLEIESVLCAIDLGPQSSRVLCGAIGIAKTFGAKLMVAHAAPPIGSWSSAGDEAWRTRAEEQLRCRIEQVKSSLGEEAETLIEHDHPARAISELARKRRASLVVLGRGVSTELIGRLRAHAYDIIRQCPCPVVSV